MRAFMRPTAIRRLSLEARILYTGFALFMLLGGASSIWLYSDAGLGTRADQAARAYLGEPAAAADAEAEIAPDAGPALQLPAESPAPLYLAKPPRQVLEAFHFHVFIMPVVLLIIAHLFMMCSLTPRLKATTIAVACAATLLHLVAPLLIRFVSAGLAGLLFPSALILGITWLVMLLLPVWEMWRDAPADPPAAT